MPWERLRAPPVDTAPHDLHISDCLNELRPGNNIEIQWRRNKEFPYGSFLAEISCNECRFQFYLNQYRVSTRFYFLDSFSLFHLFFYYMIWVARRWIKGSRLKKLHERMNTFFLLIKKKNEYFFC